MSRRFRVCWVLGVAAAASALAGPAAPAKGVTMRIVQQTDMGQLSAETDCKAYFQPPSFRIEGTMFLKAFKMKTDVTIVGNGKQVKQLVRSPMAVNAMVMDQAKIRKVMPGFSPANDWSPATYAKFIATMPDKKALPPEVLDGAKVEGYEYSAVGTKIPLPSNLRFNAPQPSKVRAWVNPADGILRKMEIEGANGTVFLRMQYKDVKTNVTIPPATFDLKFPQGAQPVDMTQMFLNQLGQAQRGAGGKTKP